jgi:predicted Zn-dependent protease
MAPDKPRARARPAKRRPRRKPRQPPPEPAATPATAGSTGREGLLEQALRNSPADETEIVWLEERRGVATSRGDDDRLPAHPETTVLVRVLERGRLGTHRTGAVDAAGLDAAVRLAIAQSRSRDTLQGLPHLPADEADGVEVDGLLDPAIVGLDPGAASAILRRHVRGREVGRLDWGVADLSVVNSRGVRRRARVTDCSLSVRCAHTPGAGRAAGSSRSLAGLGTAQVVERARRRHGSGEAGEVPAEKTVLLLAPEATIRLLELLNRMAFSASAYQQEASLLREHLGVQVFDRRINLRDDGTDPGGLPFPFDFEGTIKRPVDLVVKGAPKTPALDQRQAALLGLPPTASAVAGNDAVAQNLFLLPGEDSHARLLERCSGGVFVGWLDRVECFDAPRVRFRAAARGVRSIDEGRLGTPLPDLIWEDSLLHTLSNLSGLGSETVTWSTRTFAGAFSAPALALAEVVGLRIDPSGPASAS